MDCLARSALLTLSALFMVACASPERDDAAGARLEMVEVKSVELPDSLPVLGVAAPDSAHLVAWSSEALLVKTGREPWRRIGRSDDAVPLAVHADADGFEILRVSGVQAFGWRGEPRGSMREFPAEVRARGGTRSSEGWIVVASGGEGEVRIGAPDEFADGRDWLRISADTLPGGRHPAYRLAPAGALVFLSEPEAPFRTWRIGRDGVAGHPFAPVESPSSGAAGERWIGMPVVDLGSGIIQTLADLASDDRALIVFNRDGKQIRSARLRVPFGIVGRTGNGTHLIGVRQVGRSEVVLYGWRWMNDDTLTRGGR